MRQKLLLDVAAVHDRLIQIFNKNCLIWLAGEEMWPLEIKLGVPDQTAAYNNQHAVAAWVAGWQQWRGPGKIKWCTRKWQILGRQQLPEKIIFTQPEELVQFCNQQWLWQRISQRYSFLMQHWPQLKSLLGKCYDILANYSDEDFENLIKVVIWFIEHPYPAIYLRQLPIPGIHTKWIETHKRAVKFLLAALKCSGQQDFYSLTGVKREPELIRVRLLDPQLRDYLNGLSDICVIVDELISLQFPAQRVYIVENLRTGLAFSDLSGAVVFIGLGYSVNLLANIPWLVDLPCYYWGDLDTQGFAILNRARAYLPHLQSILMDEATLLKAKTLWVTEEKPCLSDDLSYLSPAEKSIYEGLRDNRWGYRVRLEQERIFWPDAWDVLKKSCK